MNFKEIQGLVAGIEAELKTCQAEARSAPASPRTAHYEVVLRDIETTLPQLMRVYQASAAELPAAPLTLARDRLRGVRGAQARPLDERVHDLRHDFLEIVHPLEVVGIWPPDPQPSASADAGDVPMPRVRRRGVGKWPPDPA